MADELSLVISNPKEGEFLEKITWNKDEFMKLINDVADEYKGLTYTEDQMKSAKQVLNLAFRKTLFSVSHSRVLD